MHGCMYRRRRKHFKHGRPVSWSPDFYRADFSDWFWRKIIFHDRIHRSGTSVPMSGTFHGSMLYPWYGSSADSSICSRSIHPCTGPDHTRSSGFGGALVRILLLHDWCNYTSGLCSSISCIRYCGFQLA